MMDDHMTSQRKRKGRRQHDALVPIRSDRLRAAMELGEWTVTRLAKRLGRKENPQTVHYLTQGDGLKRCRASRRVALAKLLDVTEDWLAGGDYGVPLPAVLPLLKELEGSPRVMLAVGRLFERCYRAVERDLVREPKRPDSEIGWNATYDVHWFMIGTLAHILTPSHWQGALGSLAPSESTPLVLPRNGPIPEINKWLAPLAPAPWAPLAGNTRLDPESEAAVLALLHAWIHILQPWLDGLSGLNYARFHALAAILNPAVGVMLPQSWHDRPPAKQLAPAKPTSPYALVDWPLEHVSAKLGRGGRSRRTKR
jgi:hypothetical protein